MFIVNNITILTFKLAKKEIYDKNIVKNWMLSTLSTIGCG